MSVSVVDSIAPLKGPRFSGHETFACRYAWLPKAYRALKADPDLFVDDESAMAELGLGKNMVRSLKFWVEVMNIAEPDGRSRRMRTTPFADQVLSEDGFDPYLEDPQTLWLLHWVLASRREAPLFAWKFMLGDWTYPEFTRSEALTAITVASKNLGLEHSNVTLGQHLDIFLHTYLSTRGQSFGIEDSLDGPFVNLQLLLPLGERRNDTGRWEPVFGFRREPKPDISDKLFDYCLADYWTRFSPEEGTLPLRQIALGPSSPGQVFKLSEDDVRTRLEESSARRDATYTYQPSAVQGLVSRKTRAKAVILDDIYDEVG